MTNEDALPLYAAHVETLQHRFVAALEASGFDAAVIAAGRPAEIFLDDQHHPYKVNPHLLQWAPLTEHPGSVLIVRTSAPAELLVLSPDDFWHRIPPVPELIRSGPLDVRTVTEPAAVAAAVGRLKGRTAFIGEAEDAGQAFGLSDINPPELLTRLHEERTRKTDWELSCLRAASRLAVRGHLAAEACFFAGGSEYDIHLAFRSACRVTDAELPYNAIVAVNEHAATLHYQRLERETAMNLSLLIDAGCAHHGYASDITRTHSEDPVFGALIEAMHEVQRALCDAAVAGTDYRELHRAAHIAISALLREAGVLRCEPDEAVDSGLSRSFFPHGLGHYLGLQVHDVGALYTRRKPGEDVPDGEDPWLRLTRVLEPGNVLTIEPGVYFIGSLLERLRAQPEGRHVDWDCVESLRPFGGIRIEDNIHVLADGNENLTRDAFAAADGD